jgi:uracil-DNA glycosylase
MAAASGGDLRLVIDAPLVLRIFTVTGVDKLFPRTCGSEIPGNIWRPTQCSDGPVRPEVMLIGEQAGEAEDRQGKPFVGPAGKLLNRALAEAGSKPRRAYTTNAVKHFRWKPALGLDTPIAEDIAG